MIYEKYKKYGEIIVNDPERKIKFQKIKKKREWRWMNIIKRSKGNG